MDENVNDRVEGEDKENNDDNDDEEDTESGDSFDEALLDEQIEQLRAIRAERQQEYEVQVHRRNRAVEIYLKAWRIMSERENAGGSPNLLQGRLERAKELPEFAQKLAEIRGKYQHLRENELEIVTFMLHFKRNVQ